MNKRGPYKPVITKAVLKRTIETLEAMGKDVSAVRLLPNGGVEVLTGALPSSPESPSVGDNWGAFAKDHGYG